MINRPTIKAGNQNTPQVFAETRFGNRAYLISSLTNNSMKRSKDRSLPITMTINRLTRDNYPCAVNCAGHWQWLGNACKWTLLGNGDKVPWNRHHELVTNSWASRDHPLRVTGWYDHKLTITWYAGFFYHSVKRWCYELRSCSTLLRSSLYTYAIYTYAIYTYAIYTYAIYTYAIYTYDQHSIVGKSQNQKILEIQFFWALRSHSSEPVPPTAKILSY